MKTELQKAREALNISVYGLLTSLGDERPLISVRTYNQIERGERTATPNERDVIRACINVNRTEHGLPRLTVGDLMI